jgi:hypothetical protein
MDTVLALVEDIILDVGMPITGQMLGEKQEPLLGRRCNDRQSDQN